MRTFFVAPTHFGAGLTSVSMGLFHALDRLGCRVRFFKPVSQAEKKKADSGSFGQMMYTLFGNVPDYEPIPIRKVADLLANDQRDVLMEEIVANFSRVKQDADVVIVEGLVPTKTDPYVRTLNGELAKTLSAQTVLVSCTQNGSSLADVAKKLEIAAGSFGGLDSPDILGYIVNYLAPADYEKLVSEKGFAKLSALARRSVKPLGYIPDYEELSAGRTCDLVDEIGAIVLYAGNMKERRVTGRILCARTAANVVDLLKPGTLVITPGDRDDIILAACMASQNGVPLAGILLTGDHTIEDNIMDLCMPAIEGSGLPVLSVSMGSYETVVAIDRMDKSVPPDDVKRIEMVMEKIAEHLDVPWFQSQIVQVTESRLSPPAFRYQLVCKAKKSRQRIVLPEGEEPRTVKAAIICQMREIADCILLGKRSVIASVAKSQDLVLPDELQVIDPDEIKAEYVAPMVELRKHKGLSEPMAEAMLEDNVVLGTMMLSEQHVDGLVSGAIHTTANTIRPAFQLIKTSSKAAVVSSVFFMLLPEQVLVYGDCAVNPDPTAEQLAEIAIQSADSARIFGIEPRVAMISYSTGDSGQGSDVDKVRDATKRVKELRPDLLIDGPLQYDAASVASVASSKAPNSPVAGRATVFIFPDLNTGNTTYKAVQRSANVVSVGPMLQGLHKPVNDLSRGALVDDIVYTIALTAVQAQLS